MKGPRRPFKVTGPGWIFILYTIGVGAGAINTGNNLLYLIFGVFLGLIIASGILSDSNLWRVSADWTFPESTFAQEPTSFFLTSENFKSWLPGISITVALEGNLNSAPQTIQVFVPSLDKRGKAIRTGLFTPSTRGVLSVDRGALITRFPFGLLEKKWNLKQRPAVSTFVYPKRWPVPFEEVLRETEGIENETSSSVKGEGLTASGVREFRPGDNPRRIHWKASARRQTGASINDPWLLRETDRDKKPDVVLAWPALSEWNSWQGEKGEDLVSLTAAAVLFFVERGNSVKVHIPAPGGHVWEIAEGREAAPEKRLLEFLALVDFTQPQATAWENHREEIGGSRADQEIDMERILNHERQRAA